MLLTKQFVYIHLPKTGGTFVESVLTRLYSHYADPNSFFSVNKHGSCREIPREFQGVPILTSVRNPYDWYVSNYRFAWWKRNPIMFRHIDKTRKKSTGYPDVSFEGFLDIFNDGFVAPNSFALDQTEMPNCTGQKQIGYFTWLFVHFYCKQPQKVLVNLNEEYIENKRVFDDVYDVHFVRTDKLNRSLHDFLIRVGWNPTHVEFILHEKKIRPEANMVVPEIADSRSLYSPNLKQYVRNRDRLIFKAFLDFDD